MRRRRARALWPADVAREAAKQASANFRARVESLLASYASEHSAAKPALVALERYYLRLAEAFARAHGDKRAWNAYGPATRLEVVRQAFARPEAWAELVARCAAERRAGAVT